jgi:hypothetical protein
MDRHTFGNDVMKQEKWDPRKIEEMERAKEQQRQREQQRRQQQEKGKK